jgi:hypothetical protein
MKSGLRTITGPGTCQRQSEGDKDVTWAQRIRKATSTCTSTRQQNVCPSTAWRAGEQAMAIVAISGSSLAELCCDRGAAKAWTGADRRPLWRNGEQGEHCPPRDSLAAGPPAQKALNCMPVCPRVATFKDINTTCFWHWPSHHIARLSITCEEFPEIGGFVAV